LELALKTVWSKNTIFAVYSKKFRKFPISLKSGILTPYPMGIIWRTLQKCLQIFFAKIGFWVVKHDFCKNPIGFPRNSPKPFAKNFFPDFRKLFRCLPIFAKKLDFLHKSAFFAKNGVFAKICVFHENRPFLRKILQNGVFAKIKKFFAKIKKFFAKSDFRGCDDVFCENRTTVAEKSQNRKKSFLRNPIFGRGPGEFWIIAKNRVFLTQNPIFANFFLQTFSQCPPLHPHGVGGSNPIF
jgi:hypothetical protein